jgi:hypothetical protein
VRPAAARPLQPPDRRQALAAREERVPDKRSKVRLNARRGDAWLTRTVRCGNRELDIERARVL